LTGVKKNIYRIFVGFDDAHVMLEPPDAIESGMDLPIFTKK